MLKDLINERWKEAFKARDTNKRTAYDLVKQKILIAEKSGQVELPLSDDYIVNLINKIVKEREDILTFYKPEDSQYTEAQFVITELEQYLPKPLTEDEVISIIQKFKAVESNPGKVIGLVVKEVGNRYDKSKIAALVKKE